MIGLQLKSPVCNFGLAKVAGQYPWLFDVARPIRTVRGNFPQRKFPSNAAPLGAKTFQLYRLVQARDLQRRLRNGHPAHLDGAHPNSHGLVTLP